MLVVIILGMPAHQIPYLARLSLKVLLSLYFVFLRPLFDFGQVSVFLTKVKCPYFFFQKRNMYLELKESDTEPKGENGDFKGNSQEETNFETD